MSCSSPCLIGIPSDQRTAALAGLNNSIIWKCTTSVILPFPTSLISTPGSNSPHVEASGHPTINLPPQSNGHLFLLGALGLGWRHSESPNKWCQMVLLCACLLKWEIGWYLHHYAQELHRAAPGGGSEHPTTDGYAAASPAFQQLLDVFLTPPVTTLVLCAADWEKELKIKLCY